MPPSVPTTAMGLAKSAPVPVIVAWQPTPLAPLTRSLSGSSVTVGMRSFRAWDMAWAWPSHSSMLSGVMPAALGVSPAGAAVPGLHVPL